MNAKLLYDLLKLLAVFGLIWLIFVIFPILPDKEKFSISVSREEKVGKLIVEDALMKDPAFKLIQDTYADSCVQVIMDRLLTAMDSTNYHYKFLIVRDDEINAYALPGGYVVINSSLISLTDNPEELAAVVAHEMGHIENRHIISRMIKELGINIILSGDRVVLGEVGRSAASTVYDRRQEKEADEFSLNLMMKAGIDPRVMAVFFRKIKNEVGSYNENMEILMTHPHINSRIKVSLGFDVKDDFESVPFNLDWNRLKEILIDSN